MTNSNWQNWKKGKISEDVYKCLNLAHHVRQGRSKAMTLKQAEAWTKAKVLSGETTIKSFIADNSSTAQSE